MLALNGTARFGAPHGKLFPRRGLGRIESTGGDELRRLRSRTGGGSNTRGVTGVECDACDGGDSRQDVATASGGCWSR